MNDPIILTSSPSALKEYYARYLTQIRGLGQSSVKHYYDALNNISRRLKSMGLIENDVYEITSLDELRRVRDILYADPEFIALNERGKRMYSAGLNNYYRFAAGEGFKEAANVYEKMDIAVEPEKATVNNRTVWKRSGIVRQQALSMADYTCEMDRSHASFIAENTRKPYMEGHHAIPMSLQERFDHSLDVYANIICLCPLCHRKIHYGLLNERKKMLHQIYEARTDRLMRSGLEMSRNEFTQAALR